MITDRVPRRWRSRAAAARGGARLQLAGASNAGAAVRTGTSRADAIHQLQIVRGSIDRTLALSKEGHAEEAFSEAKTGYLSHFEYVEVPLRVADAGLTAAGGDQVRRDRARSRHTPRSRISAARSSTCAG